eukprot:UN33770
MTCHCNDLCVEKHSCCEDVGVCDAEPCACKSVWTSPVDGEECEKDQYGCSMIVCDEDEDPWCITTEDWCAESAGDEWMYCDETTPVRDYFKPTDSPGFCRYDDGSGSENWMGETEIYEVENRSV